MDSINKITQWFLLLTLSLTVSLAGCSNDSDMTGGMEDLRSASFDYAFNEGQLLDNVNTAYRGEHVRNVSAAVNIDELDNGNAAVTITLMNTLNNVDYPVHVHDAADPATTPNGTPYNETPNGAIFAGAVSGNGGSVSSTNNTDIAYDQLVNQYDGFFVVHDPTQDISTTELSTYLVLGVFAQDLGEGESSLRTETFTYAFNEGQALNNDDTAYDGNHPRNLSATLTIEEKGTGEATVTVTLNNTLDGFDYPVHSHDAADPATTPNGTPYNETPNGDVFAGAIAGNGGSASLSNETEEMTYRELINNYDGFFVVHDPTQEISTTDLTTYLILGKTAR